MQKSFQIIQIGVFKLPSMDLNQFMHAEVGMNFHLRALAFVNMLTSGAELYTFFFEQDLLFEMS
jgi:hypothetical protein